MSILFIEYIFVLYIESIWGIHIPIFKNKTKLCDITLILLLYAIECINIDNLQNMNFFIFPVDPHPPEKNNEKLLILNVFSCCVTKFSMTFLKDEIWKWLILGS